MFSKERNKSVGRVQETMSVNFFGVLVLLLSLILGGSAFAKTSPKPWSHTLFKTLPNLVVEVIDPNEIPVSAGQPKPEPVRYKSYRGSEFIDKVLGGRVQWINKKYLAFTCADGYRAVLPA